MQVPAIPLSVPLQPHHDLTAFDCGEHPLNYFLKRHALANAAAGYGRTFVMVRPGTPVVIGYCTLCASAIRREDAPLDLTRAMPRHAVPAILLARLAVDQTVQGTGVGLALLGDAFWRTLQAADLVGIRALWVEAKTEKVVGFYQRFGFTRSPTLTQALYLPIQHLRAASQ